MDNPADLRQEIAQLAGDAERLRKERDACRMELDTLQAKAEELAAARLRLLSVDLSKEIRNDFSSFLKWAGWLFAIAVTVATAGGFFTLSSLITTAVEKQVKERDEDLKSLRTSMIQSVADFKVQARTALDDIKAAETRVREAGEKAEREIGIRVTASINLPVSSSANASALPAAPVTIPVVVHVVYRTPQENISDEQVRSQLAVLNADYQARNADLSKVPDAFKPAIGDASIRFVLAEIDPAGRPTTGITRTKTSRTAFGDDDGVKSRATGGTDAWDTERYLNIWVCTMEGGLLTYAQFPGGPRATDGVVVSQVAFGTVGSAQAPFNKGRTTTSAIAKYLNLRHIWGDRDDCVDGDFIADTPIQQGPNFGKPTFPHITCNNGPNGDMFMNFLDYVDDDAMYMFTKGQVLRMHETLQGPRKKLAQVSRPTFEPPSDYGQ